jgi:hypothetical protein
MSAVCLSLPLARAIATAPAAGAATRRATHTHSQGGFAAPVNKHEHAIGAKFPSATHTRASVRCAASQYTGFKKIAEDTSASDAIADYLAVHLVDEAAMMKASTFPISPKALIVLAKGRGLHSLTSKLNLRTFRNTSLTLELNLSSFGPYLRV